MLNPEPFVSIPSSGYSSAPHSTDEITESQINSPEVSQ